MLSEISEYFGRELGENEKELVNQIFFSNRRIILDASGARLRASFIVELLSFFCSGNKHYSGFVITGVEIEGGLFLETECLKFLEFRDCFFISMQDDADKVQFQDQYLEASVYISHSLETSLSFQKCNFSHPVILHSCKLSSSLKFDQCSFLQSSILFEDAVLLHDLFILNSRYEGNSAFISASNLEVGGNIYFESVFSEGVIALHSSHINGSINTKKSTFENRRNIEPGSDKNFSQECCWIFEQVNIQGNVVFDDTKVLAANTAIVLIDSSIGNNLIFSSVEFEGSVFSPSLQVKGSLHVLNSVMQGEYCILAENLCVHQSLKIVETSFEGDIDLSEAQISGSMMCREIFVNSKHGDALNLRNAIIENDLSISLGHLNGSLILDETHTKGHVFLRRLFISSGETAVQASYLKCGNFIFEFCAIQGVLRLDAANIEGMCSLNGSNISSTILPVSGRGMIVGGDLTLWSAYIEKELLPYSNSRIEDVVDQSSETGEASSSDSDQEGENADSDNEETDKEIEYTGLAINITDSSIGGSVNGDAMTIIGDVALSRSTIGRYVRFSEGFKLNARYFDARQIHVQGGLDLSDAEITAEVQLGMSYIGGSLRISDSKLVASKLHSIDLRSSVIVGEIYGNYLHSRGSIHAEAVKVGGGVNLDNCELAHENKDETKPLISFPRGEVGLSFSLIGADVNGKVDLRSISIGSTFSVYSAKIVGNLSLRSATINDSLEAMRIVIENGRLDLSNIRISSNIDLTKCRLSSTSDGVAIIARQGVIDSSVWMSGTVKGNIVADGINIKDALYIRNTKIDGSVVIPAAKVGTQFSLSGTQIKGSGSSAIRAFSMKCGQSIIFDKGFSAKGMIDLRNVEVADAISFRDCSCHSAAYSRLQGHDVSKEASEEYKHFDEIAISFTDAVIGMLNMPEVKENRPVGIVDFSRAKVATFVDSADTWPNSSTKNEKGYSDHLILDGFLYEHLEQPDGVSENPRILANKKQKDHNNRKRLWKQRQAWLLSQSGDDLRVAFKPQPWEHLIGRLRNQGYAQEANELAVQKRRWERKSSTTNTVEWVQDGLLDLLAKYGYGPWRSIAWMVVVVFFYGIVWHFAAQGCQKADCRDESVFVRSATGNFTDRSKEELNRTYPAFHSLAYSLDTFLPLLSLGYTDHWMPNTRYGPIASYKINFGELLVMTNGDESSGELPKTTGKDAYEVQLSLSWGGLLYLVYLSEVFLGILLSFLSITAFTGLLKMDD